MMSPQDERTLKTSRAIIALAGFTHIFYMLYFLFVDGAPEGIYRLVVLNIFSVACYAFIIKLLSDSPSSFKISILLLQTEVILYASACVYTLGWGYGFELLFFSLLLTVFFAPHVYKTLSHSVVIASGVAFVFWYVALIDAPVNADYSDQKEMLFMINTMIVTIFSIVLAYLLEISNTLFYNNMYEEKENMRTVANYDPLTKLLNRNSMEGFFKDQVFGKNQKFALVICDIDNFKRVNDTYGHNVGDIVLVHVSNALKSAFRQEDFLCRWGGEEFLILINNATKDQAYRMVEHARTIIYTNKVEHAELSLTVSMTFGMVFCDESVSPNMDLIVKQADILLYEGKRSGKNRIIVDEFSKKHRERERERENRIKKRLFGK